ncbi:hypothetical protein [Sphingomonas bacterium]|uniref:hypothetical protein n=1 Tax=Sphingomonas bacterium TaxID=1895847 RepID=UPI0015757DAC|nr:hypothetical protein [Sphingomonas bacterium]
MRLFLGQYYQIDGSRLTNTRTRRSVALSADEAARFEQQVFDLLTKIHADEEVGRPILRSLWIGSQIQILPGDTMVNVNASPLDAETAGEQVSFRGRTALTTGKGSAATVFVSLAMLRGLAGPAAQPDAVLLHEIVHAARATLGVMKHTALGRFDNFEEWAAIMLSNMYVSSKYNSTSFRGDHQVTQLRTLGSLTHQNLAMSNPGLAEASMYRYVPMFRQEILTLVGDSEALTLKLKDAKCAFNPLRVAYNGYDGATEDGGRFASFPGFGQLTPETFAQVAARAMKQASPIFSVDR